MLCHLLKSFDIVHVLTEALLCFPYRCPDCPDSPISNIYYTEFHYAPLPTPTHLQLINWYVLTEIMHFQ